MKRIEQIYREMLYQRMEKNNAVLTQKGLSMKLGVSLSTVNYALKNLKKMGAIEIRKMNFAIVNPKKILYYWASLRNVERDVIYSTRVNMNVSEIEKTMPQNTIFTAYSGFKFMFNEMPSDYASVCVYAKDTAEIKNRFPENKNPSNVFILKQDENLKQLTLAQLFVDLWNLKEWYAKEFLDALEKKMVL